MLAAVKARGIFFIDLDGTLVGEHGVHDRVWEPLHALRDAGVRLSICTGRPGRGIAMDIARTLDPDGLHVFESGAVVMDTLGKVHARHPLTRAAITDIVAFATHHRRTLEAYTADGRYLVPARDPIIEAHEDLLGYQAELSAWPPDDDLVRLLLALPTPDWPAVESLAAPILAHVSAHEGRSPRMPNISFISMTAPNVSKATAMQTVLDHLGLTPAETAMAGDNHNDLEALEFAAFAFVPEDGRIEALALADHVVPSPSEGGIAEAAAILRERFATL
jgi:Cof subfamily protein (haloacid dehalogenase superfamily)